VDVEVKDGLTGRVTYIETDVVPVGLMHFVDFAFHLGNC